MGDDVAVLIGKSYSADGVGNPIAEETRREVFVNVSSISRNEFAAAGQRGLSPRYMLKIFPGDYDDEEEMEYRERRYAIYRAYFDGRSGMMELYLTRKAGREK